MTKSATIRARTEPELKEDAETILRELGVTPSAAINMLYKQIVHRRALPFDVSLPNAATREAMRDAEEGRDLIRADDLEELLTKLDQEDR